MEAVVIALVFAFCLIISADARSMVKTLPGFSGTLPFNFETGLILPTVDIFWLCLDLQQGYILGNPKISDNLIINYRVPFAHKMGLISDEYYESAKRHYRGDYLNVDPSNAQCINAMSLIKECVDKLDPDNILKGSCGDVDDPNSNEVNSDYRFSEDILLPSWHEISECRNYGYLLSYTWANDAGVQEALNVRKGTISKWKRCNRNLSYVKDVPDVVEHHRILSKKEYRVLVFSGDHDMVAPYIGTLAFIKSLNLTMDVSWKPWLVDDQIAGYTEKYKLDGYNLTFATVKGAGHTASVYKSKECLAMIGRWLSNLPL